MKFTITVDSEKEPDYEEKCHNLVNAQHMHTAINSYYSDVFRNKYKHAALTAEQREIMEEIIESLHEHFGEFKIE